MTPEQIEARFQRIEAILAISAERDVEREAKHDRRYEQQLQRDAEYDRRYEQQLQRDAERDAERDLRIDNLAENVELLTLSMNRLAESAIDYSRWKVETDQRFNILLEEVRSVNRRVDHLENQ